MPAASGADIGYVFSDLHREQLSIEHSMQDLDSAVGRLDNIMMSLYFVVAILIMAVVLVSLPFRTKYDYKRSRMF